LYTDLLCSEEEGGSYIEIATGLALRHGRLAVEFLTPGEEKLGYFFAIALATCRLQRLATGT